MITVMVVKDNDEVLMEFDYVEPNNGLCKGVGSRGKRRRYIPDYRAADTLKKVLIEQECLKAKKMFTTELWQPYRDGKGVAK